MPFCTIPEAIEAVRAGRMIILVDDEDRENEGDLCLAAEKTTPEAINFMTRYGRGLVCLPLPDEIADRLHLPPMVARNTSRLGTNFTVSIEARTGVTTGISAHDRARTIQVAVADGATADDLVRPGHIFPLRARDGGVMVRPGQTEGSVDLMRMAGLKPMAVICEVMNDDGTMSRLPQLEALSREHDMPICSIADIVAYRLATERFVDPVAEARLPTEFGEYRAVIFQSRLDGQEHAALIKGDVTGGEPILARIHSSCLTGDVFHSRRCDCGGQLQQAMALIEEEGKGVIVYLNQEGRGIGLTAKIRAYALQDEGLDTVEANERLGYKADLRDYGVGAQILRYLGVHRVRLLTNNPHKVRGLATAGIELAERVPLEVDPTEMNRGYLAVKAKKLGHILSKI